MTLIALKDIIFDISFETYLKQNVDNKDIEHIF